MFYNNIINKILSQTASNKKPEIVNQIPIETTDKKYKIQFLMSDNQINKDKGPTKDLCRLYFLRAKKKARRKKEPEMNREILATLKPPKSLKLKSNNANNSG